MFYLAKGLGISPEAVMAMEFAEFCVWTQMLADHDKRVYEAEKKALADAKRASKVRSR